MSAADRFATRLPFVGFVRTNWSRDPFSWGSYSYIARRSGIADVRAAAEPLGSSVFFAGEAMNPSYQSTVHAAYESGVGAAGDVVASGRRRVGIIGAGAAGLAAATTLQRAGADVAVIEGRDRIGGRVFTFNAGSAALALADDSDEQIVNKALRVLEAAYAN